MISEFKTGSLYKLLQNEELYRFFDKNKDEYDHDELDDTEAFLIPAGAVLMYIKTITEVWTTTEHKVPVFYHDNGFIISYRPDYNMARFLEEVVCEPL